ncbi:MAG TPA: hypothetical protein VK206_04605 [Anaerolineales bacterium]|nr:hypothetical protein [Anaerolineales bacterium]
MFQTILERFKSTYQQETPADRSQRMIPAAVSGVLIATAYVLTYFFINVYTFPNLPLGLDWARMFGMWLELSLALALFGAVAAWFTEEHVGIVGGGIIFTVLAGIVFLLSSHPQNRISAVQAIIMAFPLLGVSMLGSWGLRWAAHRYLTIKREGKPDRHKRLTKHVLTLTLIGLIPGILMRMDLPAEQSLAQLHELLQAAPNDPSVWPRLPLKQVPSLQDHFGVDYVFYSRPSALSAGALDVTVRFSDGYTMSCVLPVGSGTSFITQCNEGSKVKASP